VNYQVHSALYSQSFHSCQIHSEDALTRTAAIMKIKLLLKLQCDKRIPEKRKSEASPTPVKSQANARYDDSTKQQR
jgi:hypothetical protein